MAYDLAKVTANGNNLIAQILANKSSLSVDKIEISDTQLPSTTDISTMTSVPKVVQTVSANGFSKNSNTLIISTVVDNSSISADYKAWVFGIWGSDSQNGQSQLIAVITSTNSPDTIPAFSGSTPVSYTYKFNIGFSNASQIQFNMIDDSFATNDTVVHTTGDETIDGQKKFKTDPTDSAGNAYAKTVDVNQQLDKKVNVADMRKPASEVASINEVVKDNGDGSISFSGLTISFKGSVTGDFNNYRQTGLYSYNTANGAINNSIGAAPDGILIVISESNGNIYHFIITSYSERYFRIYFGGKWYDWHKQLFAEDLTAGLATKADDSKVAHLSGANNFDTVPTVNNNPLLLASSLPSDLARTGQANTFSLLQTFSQGIKTLQTGSYDDANSLVNEGLYFNTNLNIKNGPGSNTAGYIQVMSGYWERVRQFMYSDVVNNLVYTRVSSDNGSTWSDWVQIITSDQIPTDLARTGQPQTFTAAQTFSIAPTITDASTDKGGNQAATMADLKSVEASAWRQLDNKYIIPASGYTLAPFTTILYKIDDSIHTLYLSGSIALTDGEDFGVPVTVQLGSIVKSILTSTVQYLGGTKGTAWYYTHANQLSTNLTFYTMFGDAAITADVSCKKGNFVTYDSLVNN